MKEKKMKQWKNGAIVVFVAGFFFNPVVAAIGAIAWGGLSLFELIKK